MADVYAPWRSQSSYPSMDDPNALEEVARQRTKGIIRQRQGTFPSFYSKLMELFGMKQPEQPEIMQNSLYGDRQ